MEKLGPYLDVINLYSAVGQFAIALATLWIDNRRKSGPGTAETAVPVLRRIVGQACIDEVRRRGLRFPLPLQLSWRPLSGPGPDGPAFHPLESGKLDDDDLRQRPAASLVEAFENLVSPRMLILGDAGAGKSTLALLFTLSALDQHSQRIGSPDIIPVLLPLSRWRPHEETLREYIVRRIPQEYPLLAKEPLLDTATVQQLFDDGRILPVLDGLDEFPPSLINRAIARLNDYSASGNQRLVVTCRKSDYETATESAESLSVTETVVIDVVQPHDTIRYLAGARSRDSAKWAAVSDRILSQPDGQLAAAFATPLMTSMARAVYESGTTSPDELCDMSTKEEIEEHLLGRLLAALHPGDGTGHRYDRPLSILAYYLEPDLAWWELVLAVPRIVITSLITVFFGLIGAAAAAIFQPFRDDWLINAAHGAIVGLTAGFVVGLSASRSVLQQGKVGKRGIAALSVIGAAARGGLAAMAITGASLALIQPAAIAGSGIAGLVEAITFAGLGGLAIGLITNGLSAGRGLVPSHTKADLRGLPPWLGSGILTGLAAGAPISVAVGFVAAIQFGSANGLSTGLLSLATIAVGIGVPVGIGRWLGAPKPDKDLPTPSAMLRADRTALIVAALTSGLAVGTAAVIFLSGVTNVLALDFLGAIPAWQGGLVCGLVGFGVVVCGSGSPWFSYVVARLWFATVRHQLPWNLIRFLDLATTDNLVRCTGAVYQFRHPRLRSYLSRNYAMVGRAPAWLTSRELTLSVAGRRNLRLHRLANVARSAASVLALSSLFAGIGVSVIPQLSAFVDRRNERTANIQARSLVRQADELRFSDPDLALRLRIAAAAVDEDAGSKAELSAFLRMQAGPLPRSWGRANRVLSTGSWAVTLDRQFTVTAWDLDSALPSPVVVARDVQEVLPVGHDGWLELVHLDGTATLRLLSSKEKRTDIELGPEPERVEVLGSTGWVMTVHSGRVTALNLSSAAPVPVVLSERSESAVVLETGWIVLVASSTSTAWHPEDGLMQRPITLGTRVRSLRAHKPAIVDLLAADGKTLSRWIFSRDPAVAIDLSLVLRETPPVIASSASGHWVFTSQGSGPATAWNVTGGQPVDNPLAGEQVIAAGPAEWVVVTGSNGAQALNMAASPPTAVPLGRDVANAQTGPGSWLVVTSRSGGHTAWNLSASPAITVELGNSTTPISNGGSRYGWLTVHPTGDRPSIAWNLTETPPRAVSIGGKALTAYPSQNGKWVLATFTDEWTDVLTALWDVSDLNTVLPQGITDNPVAYACGIVERGLSPDEWARYAPDFAYRETCTARS